MRGPSGYSTVWQMASHTRGRDHTAGQEGRWLQGSGLLFFFNDFFLFNWKSCRKRSRDRLFHLLAYFSNGYNSQDWSSWRPGFRDPSFAAFQGHWQGAGLKAEKLGLKPLPIWYVSLAIEAWLLLYNDHLNLLLDNDNLDLLLYHDNLILFFYNRSYKN